MGLDLLEHPTPKRLARLAEIAREHPEKRPFLSKGCRAEGAEALKLAQSIVELRDAAGWTFQEIADELGYSKAQVWKIYDKWTRCP